MGPYPVAQSVFVVSYEPAGADPSAEIARLKAENEQLTIDMAHMVECAHACDEVDAEVTKLRADVERKKKAIWELKNVLRTVQDLFERGLVETSENHDGFARSVSDQVDAALADTADKLNEGG